MKFLLCSYKTHIGVIAGLELESCLISNSRNGVCVSVFVCACVQTRTHSYVCKFKMFLKALHNMENNLFFVQIDSGYQKCERSNLCASYITSYRCENYANTWSIILASTSVRNHPYIISLVIQLNITLYMVT